jgi:hypothetical protein
MLRDPRDFVILCFLALRRDDVSSLFRIAKICPIGGLKFYLFGSISPLYFILFVHRSVPYKTVGKGKLLRVFLDSAT